MTGVNDTFDDSDFDIFHTCAAAHDYDYSIIEYKDIVDGAYNDLKINMPYAIIKFQESIRKYDIETDKIEEVTIITLQSQDGTFRIAAPFALIEHMQIIGDKLCENSRLFIIRKENNMISCFIR